MCRCCCCCYSFHRHICIGHTDTQPHSHMYSFALYICFSRVKCVKASIDFGAVQMKCRGDFVLFQPNLSSSQTMHFPFENSAIPRSDGIHWTISFIFWMKNCYPNDETERTIFHVPWCATNIVSINSECRHAILSCPFVSISLSVVCMWLRLCSVRMLCAMGCDHVSCDKYGLWSTQVVNFQLRQQTACKYPHPPMSNIV